MRAFLVGVVVVLVMERILALLMRYMIPRAWIVSLRSWVVSGKVVLDGISSIHLLLVFGVGVVVEVVRDGFDLIHFLVLRRRIVVMMLLLGVDDRGRLTGRNGVSRRDFEAFFD